MDYFHAPAGIFDPKFKDKQHLDKEQLDRLDYFIYQLKQHGIYTNINLHVSRAFTAADGFPDTDRLPGLGKVVDFFEPRMIELQKNYARDLLTHVNPYTQARYVDEPAVAVVEINNENTLLGAAWDETLDKLPPHYQRELSRQWSAWLKTKYGDTAGLKSAWKVVRPLGPNLLRNADFADGTRHWKLEVHPGAAATVQTPKEVLPPSGEKVARIEVKTPGKQNWHIQFNQSGLDLVDGQAYTVSFWAKANRKRILTVNAGLDKEDWHSIGLSGRRNLDTEWSRFTLVFTAQRPLKQHNRLTFVVGDEAGAVDLAGLSLQQGVETVFPSGASLEAGNIPLSKPVPGPAGHDWISFLIHSERKYQKAMLDYIKKDLGAHALVTGSQASYGGLGGALRESLSDFTDMHAYWQHPEFPRKPWDPVDWRIRNTAMVRDPNGGTLPGLARYRLAGKAFTVSEYNHAAPHDYQAECVPMLAAFAALQDWDGIYLFDYLSDRKTFNSNRIRGFFAIDSNPAKMAFLPAAAVMFLRGDVQPANEESRLLVGENKVPDLMIRHGRGIGPLWEAAGNRGEDAFTKRLSVAFAPGKGEEATIHSVPQPNRSPESTSPLQWPAAGKQRPVFTADSPASKVMAGFLAAQRTELPGWKVQMKETPLHFAAFTLTGTDGKPIAQSRSLLLTAVARVENTGMQWNSDRTSVGSNWGEGPTLAEGVPATIAIRTTAKSAQVHALDGTGKRQGTVNAKLAEGWLTFEIGAAHKTLCYEVETDQ